MNYNPLEDRVLVRPIQEKESEKTEGGIILDMVKKEVAKGEVVAVGAGRYAMETGVLIENVLRKGDIVLYGINQGMDLSVDKETLRLMRESDVLLLIGRKEEMNGTPA